MSFYHYKSIYRLPKSVNKNMIEVAGVKIPLISGPVGICLSGGADSSLLLYILLKNLSETIYVFTLAKDTNGRASAIISSNVIEKCIRLTNNSNIVHHVYYRPIQNNTELFSVPADFYNKKIIVGFYEALTANPVKHIADGFLGPEWNTEQQSRDPSITREIEHTTICGFNAKVFTPFININKIKIAEMYSELKILNDLFPVTRSCEVPRTNYLGHCGECWWCKEREWAFGELK